MSNEIKVGENRLYSDLAWIWPLWVGVEGYKAECEEAAELIAKYSLIEARTILDIGCGGGMCAYNLKRHFKVTGVDISKEMLEGARKLNPDCEFLKADMRSFDLGRMFDAVFFSGSIGYMQTRDELRAAFESAGRHLKPGGVIVTRAENTKESFVQNKTYVSHAGDKDVDVTIIENYYDPDPADETFEGTMVFLIREAGKLRIEHDRHVVGIFPLKVWREVLTDLGFEIFEQVRPHGEDGSRPLQTFVCRKPL
jgi:SAM-dependent methyltransferase